MCLHSSQRYEVHVIYPSGAAVYSILHLPIARGPLSSRVTRMSGYEALLEEDEYSQV